MRINLRGRGGRVLAAVALIGVALSLSACVSDSSGSAFGAAVTPTPAAPTAVPTMAPISRAGVAATVSGDQISNADYADLVVQERKAIAQQLQQQPGSTPPTESQVRAAALTTLVNRLMIAHYATKNHIIVAQADVDKSYASFEKQLGGPITFTRTLADYGYTLASFKQSLYTQMLRQKVMNIVTPLGDVEQVRARHILVKTKAQADKLYAELTKDPSKFAADAKKYSTDTSSGTQGGELGWFGRGQMVPQFEAAAFSQPIGTIGKPVQSQYGWHIIQVEQKRTIPVSQLDQTSQQTYQQQQLTKFSQWLDALRGPKGPEKVQVFVKGITLLN